MKQQQQQHHLQQAKRKKHVAIHVDRLLNVSYRSDVINIKTKASPIATRTKTQQKKNKKQTKSFSKCYFKNAAKYFCYCCCLHFYSISVVAIAFFSWACCLQCFSVACCWWQCLLFFFVKLFLFYCQCQLTNYNLN